MTNKQIIRAAAERLDPATLHQIAAAHHTPEEIAAVAASCKIVDKDGNEKPATAADIEIMFAADELHTFDYWKKEGKSVKKGEKALIECYLWKYTTKPSKEQREKAAAEGKEAAPDPHYYPNGNDVYITTIKGDVTIQVESPLASWFPSAVAYDEGTYTEEDFIYAYPITELSYNNKWTYTWSDLPTSEDRSIWYTLEEVSSTDGYTTSYVIGSGKASESCPQITLTPSEGVNAQVVNRSTQSGGYVLPSTGGAGTKLYTAGGGALMLAALVCGVCRKRRRERRAR